MNDEIDIGDEVICINSFIKPENKAAVNKNFPIWIKEGDKYIVRDIMFNDNIAPGLLIQNRKNPPIWIPLLKRMQEPAFALWRFKKQRSAYQLEEEAKKEEVDVKQIVDKFSN
jgi:hypothetical protein